jgi:dimethylamine monooxygenase subunit A
MDAMTRRLPGLQPLRLADFLIRDEAFAGQMARRDQLVTEKPEQVFVRTPEADAACGELLSFILRRLQGDTGYRVSDTEVVRPDGAVIPLGGAHPLFAAGRLVQQDLLVLLPRDGVHRLAAGFLAFPASWSLQEKMGRPLSSIHAPVARIEANLAARIERVLAHLRPGEPVWRANWLRYNDPELHQPRTEAERRPFEAAGPIWLRVERQALLKLVTDQAVVFSIHTYVVPFEALSPDQAASLSELDAAP